MTLKGDTRVVSFSPDGTQLARVAWPEMSTIQFWDIHKGREVKRLSTEGKSISTNIAFSPDGRQAAAGAGAWGRAFIWNLETSAMVETFVPTGYVKSVAFSPDGRFLVSGGLTPATHGVLLWNIATGTEEARLQAHTDGVNFVAFSPDGKRLISAGKTLAVVWDIERKVKIAHLTTVEEQPLIDAAFDAKPIAVSPMVGGWQIQSVVNECFLMAKSDCGNCRKSRLPFRPTNACLHPGVV
jgi:WD40 repeat protein